MIFSKIILFVSSVFLLSPLFNKLPGQDSCLLYKKGKFVQHINSTRYGKPFVYDISIERNDTTELLYCPELLRDTVVQRIRWISGCTYEIIPDSAANHAVISCFGLAEKNIPQTITIVPAGKYYIRHFNKQTDTIWVKELHITLSEEDE